MKRILPIIFIVAFVFLNALSFFSCRSEQPAQSAEVRACWVSSIGNLDFPSKMGLSAEQLRSEINAIIKECKTMGLNTIYFQVRPNGDALYRSEVFPWSKYLSGKQGVAPDKGFDPLTYFTDAAHKNNIQLHAWINPYRIATGKNVGDSLSADNPAILHPEYTIKSASGLYYNPGLPQVRALILDGIRELICNYEIDGIHFDDYFYPYDMTGFDDSDTFKKYGNGQSLAEFRRASVNELVRSAYTLIKSQDPNKEFGISPFGIWANKSVNSAGSNTKGMSSYSAIFSDSKKWVEQGWVDYICPQVYWSFDHQAAPFAEIVDWWNSVCRNTDVKLYIGIAAYKVNTDEIGWDEPDQISKQLQYISKKESCAGHCFFRYGVLIDNPLGIRDSIMEYYNQNKQNAVQSETIKPITVQKNTTLKINSPKNGAEVNASKISVSGTTAPGERVTINGVSATVSEQGYFSAYIPLKEGNNMITATSGGLKKSIHISRKKAAEKKTKLDVNTFYPQGSLTHLCGDVVQFSVDAPQGMKIALTNGRLTIPLNAENGGEKYAARWTVPALSMADDLLIKDFVLRVTDEQGKVKKVPVDLTLHLYAAGNGQAQYLKSDAYLFDQSNGGSQMDHQPLAKGSEVVSVAEEGSRALLKNGFWVEREALSPQKTLPEEPSDYNYEKVIIYTNRPCAYVPHGEGKALNIEFERGRNEPIDIQSEAMMLNLAQEYKDNTTTLRISSKADHDLAGYEIYPQGEKITIYVRFHSKKLRGKTILLDAGHGGNDCGALGPGGAESPAESELNMLLAQYLKVELIKAGATVLFTRDGDQPLGLDERVELSKDMAPDLFISLHHNSVEQVSDFNKASGGLVLYSSALSKNLAEQLSKNLWAGISEKSSVEVRRQSLRVCRQIRCPAVLIEAGYLCNPIEYEMLCQGDNAEKIAKNIVIGLKNYFVSACS